MLYLFFFNAELCCFVSIKDTNCVLVLMELNRIRRRKAKW